MRNATQKLLSALLTGIMLLAHGALSAQTSSGGSSTLYGCVLSSFGDYFSSPGIFKFNPYNVSTFSSVAPGIKVYGGGTYANGIYYGINYTEAGTTITLPDTLRLYDTKNNWAVTKSYLGGSITALASDLTYDPVTGNIYGVFFNADYTDCKSFGTLSLDNPIQGMYSSSIIADLPERMVAIAANQKGVIYAIGLSGKLYTVDKQTGAATEVGSTGVSDVSSFFQSACCDMKTGKIFWAACYGQYYDYGIYEVDPTTGAAKLVGDMGYDGTYNEDQLTGITTLEDVARPVFVNGVDNLAAAFDKNSLAGQITFTLPTQDSKGEALTGDVSYALSIDGAAAGQGKGAAGASVSMDVTTTAGQHAFTVVATQEGKDGDPRTVRRWVGDDYPQAPEGLNAGLAAKNDKGADINVKWNAVKKGKHGGYVDPAKVAYTLLRMPDSTQVYAGSDTTYADHVVTDETKHYSYRLWATHQALNSDTVASNQVTVSGAHVPPYNDDFTDETKFSEWTVVDNNHDNSTWHRQNGYLEYTANSKNAADDYAISPAMKLKAGNLYNISFIALNAYPTEKVALYAGKTPTAAGMTTELIAPVEVTYQPRQHQMLASFRPETDGIYYFGIKACSDADMSSLYAENFSVTAVPATAPAKPDNLVVTPGAKGAQSATVSFKTPTKTIGGDALQSIDAVVVERDGEQVFTSAGTIRPGDAVTVTDDGASTTSMPAVGSHIYKVYCVAASVAGDFATGEAYVGVDVPGAVDSLRAVEDINRPGTVIVSWQAPKKGQHGGYVDPATLSYVVSVGTSGQEVSLTDTSYTDHLDISKGQTYQGYSVYAVNGAGSGRNVWQTVTAIAGPADVAPFVESFEQITMKSGPWLPEMLQGEIGEAFWTPCDGVNKFCGTQDGDGGVVVFDAQKTGVASMIQSPKIDISKLQQPQLSLWIYNTGKGDEATISVSADYGKQQTLQQLTLNGTPHWQRVVCDLTPWKQSHFVRVGITAKAVNSITDVFAFDNVAVSEAATNDLGVMSLEVMPKLTTGTTTKLLLKVRNFGSDDVNGADYQIKLYKNGRLANTLAGADVAVGQTASVALPDQVSTVDADSTAYYAEIVYPTDEYTANNVSDTVTTEVVKNRFPAPTGAQAQYTSDGVKLSWTAPDPATAPQSRTTDSFESYEAFTTSNVGDWTLIDGDTTATIRMTLTGMTTPLSYPHAGEKMAFQVFNTEEAGIPFSSWDPHTGSQMLVAFKCASPDQGKTEVANNDWLISPELSGKAQSIAFYAKTGMGGNYTPEEFEILYSTTSKDTTAFVKVGDTHRISNVSAWDEIRENLPEGARWFAIHYVSKGKFALLLDDISYTDKDAPQEDLTLTGYRVYRDSAYVGEVTANELTFTDNSAQPDNTYRYQVSALYDKGESPLSDAAMVTTTGVRDLGTSQALVRGDKGAIVIRHLSGQTAEVFTLNGLHVASVRHTDATTLHVSAGVYLVRLQGGQTVKVVVK